MGHDFIDISSFRRVNKLSFGLDERSVDALWPLRERLLTFLRKSNA